MENALLLNGVYEGVLEEIIQSQENNPGKVFYLQPYSASAIKQLKSNPPEMDSTVPLYLSTTNQLNQICYVADIVGWEDKNELSQERLALLNEHIKEFQPGEGEIYFGIKDKKCANLISIINLKKVANQLSTANLIKESDGTPLKTRSRAGGWSYVKILPLLSIDQTIVADRLYEEFEEAVSQSISDDGDSRKRRLESTEIFPEKVQTISYGFKRNPDVVAEVLNRASGKCELCQLNAPFNRASNGSPYLEVHHWISLSDGGEDTINNAGALCPNCHKQAHWGEHKDYIQFNKAFPGKQDEIRHPPYTTGRYLHRERASGLLEPDQMP